MSSQSNSRLHQILTEVAETTFENLAFMFPMSDDGQGPPEQTGWASAKVDFAGQFSGTLFVGVSQGILPALADNMLGTDKGSASVEDQHDALKELANIICGNLLPVIAGTQAVFNVHPPELCEGDAGQLNQCENQTVATSYLTLDEGLARIALIAEDLPEGALTCTGSDCVTFAEGDSGAF